jgi:gentisate 1,2-dioxygenase
LGAGRSGFIGPPAHHGAEKITPMLYQSAQSIKPGIPAFDICAKRQGRNASIDKS